MERIACGTMAGVMAILLTAWSFLVTPSLCVAGALHHACGHEPTGGHQHEETCPQNPCGALVITAGPGRARVNEGTASGPEPVASVPAEPAQLKVPAGRAMPGHLRPPRLKRLPFPASDIPLLI